MGNSKISPLVIVVLMVILAAVAFVAVRIMNGESAIPGVDSDKGKNVDETMIVPVLSLELDTEEDDQDKVIIKVSAQVDDEEGIESIILPDGTIINAPETEYIVTENGTYTFKATSVAGGQSTSDIKVSNIRLVSADNPYIPEGFSYIGGEVETGYVIADKVGNEYVWVPCPRGILERETLLDPSYSESSDSATELVNSVAKYYGFYMGRYEASAYDTGAGSVAVSLKNKTPWTDITYIDAAKAAKGSAEFFKYEEGVKTNIISSYAWDTTLNWIDETVKKAQLAANAGATTTSFSTSLNYGNYSGSIKPTGTTQEDKMNNICDLAGNVREWTTEIYKGNDTGKKKNNKKKDDENILTRMVRGGGASLSRTAASHTAYEENKSEQYWGFRLVMYKM